MSRTPARLVFALGLAAATTSFSGLAFAQTAGRSLHVLGLRAPNGDNQAAETVTRALRQLAGQEGYAVQEGSPSLEAEMAVVDCSTEGPSCLERISQDLSSPRVLYGSLTRSGRSASAPAVLAISLWSGDRVVASEQITLQRSNLANEGAVLAVNELTTALHRMSTVDVERAAPAQNPTPLQTNNNTSTNTNVVPPQVIVRETPRTPVLRYIGFGAVGVGVVLGGIGIWQWVASSSRAGSTRDATQSSEEPYGSWARFQGEVNLDGRLSASEVCDRANASGSANAAQVRDLCSSNSTSQALALGLGISGAVLAGVGAVLIAIDRPRAESAPTTQPANGATARRPLPLQVNPLVGQVNGLHLSYTF